MPLDQERPDRRNRNRDRNRPDRNEGNTPVTDTEGPPLKYDLDEIDRRRNWVGEQIWQAVASGRLNLRNVTAVSNFLRNLRPDWFGGEHGIVNQKEKGRHMRSLFMGGLDEEGWGMGDNGYARAIDEYKPNWRRMIEGMNRDPKTGLYGTDGGKWYDAFGRLVRTDPIRNPLDPEILPPPPPVPGPDENKVFYGGSNAPNPYGTEAPGGIGGGEQQGQNNNIGNNQGQNQQRKNQGNNFAPGWYNTWRF